MLNTKKIMNSLSHDSDILYIPTDDELKAIQRTLLGIYKDIEMVCEENNLRLMLSGGSAIGAVRHKGFIPWDDDLDILMPRKDFEIFKKVFCERFPQKYEMSFPADDESGLQYIYPKIHKVGTEMVTLFDNSDKSNAGVHVDIFIIDFAPNNKAARKIKAAKADVMRFLLASGMMYKQRNETAEKYFTASLGGKLNYFLRMRIGAMICKYGINRYYNKFDKYVNQESYSDYSTCPTGRGHYSGEILPTSVFLPPQKVEFENTTAYIPNDVDSYLKNLFGEYMTIPPKEKQERHGYIRLKL